MLQYCAKIRMKDAREYMRRFCFDSWLTDGYHIDPKNDNCAVDNEFSLKSHQRENNRFIWWVRQYFHWKTKQNKTVFLSGFFSFKIKVEFCLQEKPISFYLQPEFRKCWDVF